MKIYLLIGTFLIYFCHAYLSSSCFFDHISLIMFGWTWIQRTDWKQMGCVIILKDYIFEIFWKNFGYNVFLLALYAFKYGRQQSASHFKLFFYREGKNATQASNTICAVYRNGDVAGLVGLKLLNWTLKIKNALVDPPPLMNMKSRHLSIIT